MTDDFLNLHVIVTTAMANPNRDDLGAPKQVTYGGADGYRAPSVTALLDQHDQVRAFTPRQFPQPAWYAGTLPAGTREGVTVQPSLDALVDACVDWALAGRPAR